MASASTPSLERTFTRDRINHYRPRRRSNHDRTTLALPQRFQGISEETEGDAARSPDNPLQEKSLYGMIAQVGDFGKFTQRWQQGDESGSDGEPDIPATGSQGAEHGGDMTDEHTQPSASTTSDVRKHRKRLSETKLLKAFLKPSKQRRESETDDTMTQSQFLPPRESPVDVPPRPSSADIERDTSLLDRQLRAQARAERVATLGTESRKEDGGSARVERQSLSSALADIFSLPAPEEVIAEYSCWYMQNVLLQGFMYITSKHVCFYAYLQKRAGTVVRSGHLGKRGKQNPRFYRYYFVLKGNVLSYYSDATQPYFPSGTIDLRYAISAEVVAEKDDYVYFNVTTNTRVYQLRADSLSSAQEWVRQLQKVIFRSRNEGDSIKISLPLENVLDVEANPVVSSTDTVKLRVIDNDSTFAVDEYFFHFSRNGQDALKNLSRLTQDNQAKKTLQAGRSNASVRANPGTSTKREPVRTIVSPLNPGSPSNSQTSDESDGDNDDQEQNSTKRFPSRHLGRTKQDNSSTEAVQDMSASQILSSDSAFSKSHASALPDRSRLAPSPLNPAATIASSSSSTPLATSQVLKEQKTAPSLGRLSLNTGSVPRTQLDQKNVEPTAATIRTSLDSNRPTRPATSTLQSAAVIAGYVRDQGKRMSSYLSGSPRDYYDRFSGAIVGGKRHYSEAEGLAPDDRFDDEDEAEVAEHERRFRAHFALPESEKLVAVFYASLHRVLPLYGKIYLSNHWLCFRSLLYGTRTKLVIPIRDIDNVEKQKGFRIGYPGIVLVLRGHEELFFDFRNKDLRNDCAVTILRNLDNVQPSDDESMMTDDEVTLAQAAAAEHQLLQDVRRSKSPQSQPDIAAELGPTSVVDFKPKESLRIVCLTIGSRGDVQPYIALCKGLIAEGHRPKIATHVEFGDWVKKHGIDFTPVGGNPAELMKLCVELGMFTPKFIYETNYKFRGWLDELLETSWEACKDADLLIESPSAMAGIHIAEALGIPYFRAFTMMWTRTRAYPHAFAAMNYKMGGTYNLTTYGVFENVFWQMTANQINRWRKKTLGIGPTNSSKLQQNKVPFLYNFSPSFVVPPLDFSDWVRITGYWFLDEGTDWTPPADLLAFIQKARDDNVKLVYIGFGSIVVSDSKLLTQSIVDAVVKADVRCILSKGWSDRLDAKSPNEIEVALPDSIYQIGAAPHDWLFRQVDAAVHHGGAGTTGASLRAGIPTIIKPFFGDQFFSASRVEDVGVGIRIMQISPNILGKALWIATHDDRMRKKARILGERIRAEDGVSVAIKAIYRDLEYAKTLIKRKVPKPVAAEGGDADDEEEAEESWTFVEADSDFETVASHQHEIGDWTVQSRQNRLRLGRYDLGALIARD